MRTEGLTVEMKPRFQISLAWREHPTSIQQVMGSIPLGRLTFLLCSTLIRQRKGILRIYQR